MRTDPIENHLQRWIFVKPMTGAHIGSSKIRHDMLVRYLA